MFKWLSIVIAFVSLVIWASEDRGIGGTGKYADEERGLGGTGVIGTITEFGSIWVNGLEIELDDNTQITVDGVSAKEGDLRLGQQVAVLATQKSGQWWAQSIKIRHALIGIVEDITETNHWVVQGVNVAPVTTLANDLEAVSIGEAVKISGYFHQGVLYATDIVSAGNISQWQLYAPVDVTQNDSLLVGAIPLPDVVLTAEEGEWVTLKGDIQKGISKPFFIGREDVPFIDKVDSYIVERPDFERGRNRIETLSVQQMRDSKASMRVYRRTKGDEPFQKSERSSPEAMSVSPDLMPNFEGLNAPSMKPSDSSPFESRNAPSHSERERPSYDNDRSSSAASGPERNPSDRADSSGDRHGGPGAGDGRGDGPRGPGR